MDISLTCIVIYRKWFNKGFQATHNNILLESTHTQHLLKTMHIVHLYRSADSLLCMDNT